jgi:trehalose utilization protein
MNSPTQVIVWGEFRHEKTNPAVAAIYPGGMRETIAGFLRHQPDVEVATAFLDQPENGLPVELLDRTDVLVWWDHLAHGEVADEDSRPGHETFPTYHLPEIQKILINAVRWAAPSVRIPDACPNSPPLESLDRLV